MPIRLKLIIFFLEIALIPIIFVSMLTFHNYKNSIEELRFSQMRYLTALKAERIEVFFASLKADIEIEANFYRIKGDLSDNKLSRLKDILKLNAILLFDKKGKAIVAHGSPALSAEGREAVEAGKKGTCFSDIYNSGGRFLMLVAAPVSDDRGAFAGVIAFETDMEPVYKLIQDATGLGESGETLIGKKYGNEVLYLNPLRHDPGAALKRKVALGEKAGRPIQEASQGRTGSGKYLDYRGKKVIAAWQYMPSLDWGVVAKIDESEAFSVIANLKKLVVMILAIVSFLGGIMAVSLAQSISAPIKKLTEGAELIGSGNLDFRVGMNLKDEIGQLSRTFDKMTSDLKRITASRDELNSEIAERKRVEEELKALNKELEAFTYSVSHDLRSPLRAIDGFARILTEEYKDRLDGEGKRQFGIISDNIRRMGELIDGLLELSRMGRKELTCSVVDVGEILNSAVNELKSALEGREIDFVIGEIPRAPADRAMLRQVFINLLSNAIKFTAARKAAVIEIGGRPEEHRAVYYVRDNGAGFDARYAGKLFGIFQRLHGQGEFEGTGIGLAIVKRIINKHGGEVWAEGKVNEGAVFYFSLPR